MDETPIHDAVREALVNCLVNSDFYESRGVVIEKYLDRIIINNPGTVIVGKQQMLRGGESEPRNGNLMKMFNLIGYGERAGSGVPDIYATWEAAGYVEPTVEEKFGNDQPNRTIVTLPLVEKNQSLNQSLFEKSTELGTKSGEKQKEMQIRIEMVYTKLKENPSISQKQVAEDLEISVKQVKNVTDKLQKQGRIKRIGSAHGGKWLVF